MTMWRAFTPDSSEGFGEFQCSPGTPRSWHGDLAATVAKTTAEKYSHSSDAEFGPGHLRESALMVLSTTLGFLDTVFEGIKVQKNLNIAQKSLGEPGWLVVVDVCFAVAFVFEFLLRWQDCLLERRAGLDRVRFF